MALTLPPAPDFRLDGRRALITGGSRGIGLAAATTLAAYGAHVTLTARDEAGVADAVRALREAGYEAESLPLDVSDTVAVAAAIATRPLFDILVNNAGTNRPQPFAEVSTANFDTIFSLNVRAAFFVAQAMVRRLLEGKRPGSIINVSSQMGHVGAANRTVYCASKHALEGMTKAMAVELAACGIRVNSIAPTFIETPLTAPYFDDPAFRASVLDKIKLGRIGQLSDIGGAVLYLASDASALVTGTSLRVDGGWTAE
jgi:NAD(P)-dependent dehydrogenase (short-subunit alcohol dehydrogenase family)